MKFNWIVGATLLIATSFTSLSCSSLHRAATSLVRPGQIVEHATGAAPKEAPELYRQAVTQLEARDYAGALEKSEIFLTQNSTSSWTQAATLNAGRALEGLERWQDAALRYRSVVLSTAKAPKLQAMALYRSSFCSEALGDDTQVVATLNDLMPRAQFLPREIGEAELPARLAGAYARVGNFERAQYFYKKAEVGIAKLKQESGDKLPEWLPKTLFLMGETSRRQLSWADFETSIRPLARGQIFLLQASELGQRPWSDRAADDLIQVYEDLFTTIEGAPLPPGDAVLAKRSLQKKQWERTGLLIDLISELKARALPESKASPQSLKIKNYLVQLDKKIQNLLLERPAGEGLTAESLLRKKSRSQILRTVDPEDTSLEQAFIQNSRQAPAIATVPAQSPEQASDHAPIQVPAIRIAPPAATPNPAPEDPNL